MQAVKLDKTVSDKGIGLKNFQEMKIIHCLFFLFRNGSNAIKYVT